MKYILLLKNTVILLIVVFLYLSGFSNAVSYSAQNDKHEQIKDIESMLSSEKSKFEAYNIQEKDLLSQLADLEKEVCEKKQIIKELRKKISESRLSSEKLRKKAVILEKQKKTTEERAAERLVALYKYAKRKKYIAILADSQSLGQFFNRVTYIKSIMNEDREFLEKLVYEWQEYKTEIRKINEEIAGQEVIEVKEKAHMKNLEKELEEKVIHLVKIHNEKEFYETAVKELQLAAQNLRQTILDIGKNEKIEISQPSHFIDSKGQLPLPLVGRLVKDDRISESVRPIFEKGIFVEASSDNKVKAVFSGKVAFSGRIKGYGDIVIINHGSRFFTISANLSERKTEDGDFVVAGDTIGLVAENGSSESKKLYFEIRRGGENLDPIKWLKIR